MERGVKVKWPSKRMSVGDMNKRVRALVEWVGREQASILERGRRRGALEGALRDVAREGVLPIAAESSAAETDGDPGGDVVMATDRETVAGSPPQDKAPRATGTSTPKADPDPERSTMKMMEELMQELIGFQERFGPASKSRERERRAAVS